MKSISYIIVSICLGITVGSFGAIPDTSFIQPVSVKYAMSVEIGGSTLKKVVMDYNDIIYVLTDKGLCRVNGHQKSDD